ncbi:hypothetical protein HYZ05_02765 [Candidatus Daviesbacteria bacterium]|nr:hypothetical protein [Candidatus Daviesbacteria bacterium]
MNSHFFALFTFFLLSVFLVFSWFRQGLIYGGGDVGLQTFNPQRILEISQFIWWEATAPGIPVPQGLTAIPFNFAFSILQSIGFSPFLLQASLFFLILFFCGLGMYFLILFLFGDRYKIYAILAGLFYMVNPYMMISVWHRFVHSTFFFISALPFLTIFWLKWIRNKNPISLLIFLLINLISLYAFGTIAYILTLWLFLFLITIPEIIFSWQGLKNFKKILTVFLVGFFFWVLTNAWWLVPIFKISPTALSEQHSNEETLSTLINISRQTILPYSLQMINPFYLFYQLDLGKSYQNVFIRVLPWIFVSVIFIGLIRALFNKDMARWTLVYLAVIFFAKGAASPWGFIYIFALKYFFPLGVLRNPFEKIGILLPLVSTILFIIGLKFVYESLRHKFSVRVAAVSLVVVFGSVFIFCLPLFGGRIFGRFDKPEFVSVPQSYKDADNWIKSDYEKNKNQNPGKILHLPLTRGESINYNWEYGYSGLESSALFFTAAPSISHGFNLRRTDDSLTTLYYSLRNSHLFDQNITKRLLSDFNIAYIVLHKDVKWQGSDLYNPAETEEVLNKLNFIKLEKTFGDLMIYKVLEENFNPKIFISGNYHIIYPPNTFSVQPWIEASGSSIITSVDIEDNRKLEEFSRSTTIFSKSSFVYTEASSSSIVSTINALVSNPASKDLWLDSLIKIRPILKQNGEIQAEEFSSQIIYASEKILKIMRGFALEKNDPSPKEVDDYGQIVKNLFSANTYSPRLQLYANSTQLSQIFQIHLYILKIISEITQSETRNNLIRVLDLLKENLSRNNLIPDSSEMQAISSRRDVYKFEVPYDSDYKIILAFSKDKSIYQNKLDKLFFILDGKPLNFKGEVENDLISFGPVSIAKGSHMISFPVLLSDNLSVIANFIKGGEVNLSDDGNFYLKGADTNLSFLESRINNTFGQDIFKVNFDVKVEKGNGFNFQLLQDTDTIDQTGQPNLAINQKIFQPEGTDWLEYDFFLPPLRFNTDTVAIRFVANSPIKVRNLKIERVFNGDVFLRDIKSFNKINDKGAGKVDFYQKNPALYRGKIYLDKPSFIIFSESFHPGWKLVLSKQGKDYIPTIHTMANLYANAWYIDKDGEYDFKLEFEPERIVKIGSLLALAGYLSLIIYIILKNRKNR